MKGEIWKQTAHAKDPLSCAMERHARTHQPLRIRDRQSYMLTSSLVPVEVRRYFEQTAVAQKHRHDAATRPASHVDSKGWMDGWDGLEVMRGRGSIGARPHQASRACTWR